MGKVVGVSLWFRVTSWFAASVPLEVYLLPGFLKGWGLKTVPVLNQSLEDDRKGRQG